MCLLLWPLVCCCAIGACIVGVPVECHEQCYAYVDLEDSSKLRMLFDDVIVYLSFEAIPVGLNKVQKGLVCNSCDFKLKLDCNRKVMDPSGVFGLQFVLARRSG